MKSTRLLKAVAEDGRGGCGEGHVFESARDVVEMEVRSSETPQGFLVFRNQLESCSRVQYRNIPIRLSLPVFRRGLIEKHNCLVSSKNRSERIFLRGKTGTAGPVLGVAPTRE